MKNIIALALLLWSIGAMAQEEIVKKKVDSLSNLSRIKADAVLSHFDSIKTEKILYSVSDKHYYIVLKDSPSYKEYYISIDSIGKIKDEQVLKTSKKNRKIFSKAFNLSTYHKEFITTLDNPTTAQGNTSYFVIKDKNGYRYGEFWLPVLSAPIPIDKQLYNYILTRLLKESTEN